MFGVPDGSKRKRSAPKPGSGPSGRNRALQRAHPHHQLFLPGHTVIRKEPLGPDGERRVRHEIAMLDRLGGVAGGSAAGGDADFGGGTGLAGLKDRVEALGGRIVLHSHRGAGTTLRAELPLTATNNGGTSH